MVLGLPAAPLVESDEETGEENFLRWRVERGVAEGSTEIPRGAWQLQNWEIFKYRDRLT